MKDQHSPRAAGTSHPLRSAVRVSELAASIRFLRDTGIATLAEAGAFCEAAEQTNATIGSIAKKLGIPFPRTSRIVFALEQRGLLRYEAHPRDRRIKIVRVNALS